jgi:hypothetical protein
MIVPDVLSNLILYRNKCEALEKFKLREIKSTVPFLPETAAATFWTGLPVSQHGVTSLNGKNTTDAAIPKLWDLLPKHLSVSIQGALGEGIGGSVAPKEADLAIIQVDGLARACLNGIESKAAATKMSELSDIVNRYRDWPTIVTSPCGFTRYEARFNLAVFLQQKRYCVFSDDASAFDTSQTSAYPALLDADLDDALQFGLLMNRKPEGWLDDRAADRIQGNLTLQLSQIPNLVVRPKIRVYEEGHYYEELPDIIFYANRGVVFPTLGRQRKPVFEGFRREDYSINTVFLSNFALHKYVTKPIFVHDICAFVLEHFDMER